MNFSPKLRNCSKVGPICRARAKSWRPSLEVELPSALFRRMEDARASDGVLPSLQTARLVPASFHPLFPFLLKLVPPQDIGKQVYIERGLFAQNSHALAVLASASLQSNGY